MSKRLGNLNEIIAVLEAGAKFYRDSSRSVENQSLAQIFTEHAELREDVAKQLADVVDAAGAEPADPSAVEKARAWYAKAATFIGQTDEVLINSLEEHEDRTLEVFRNAMRSRDNDPDQEMLRQQFAAFQQSHDRMRELKHGKHGKSVGEASA